MQNRKFVMMVAAGLVVLTAQPEAVPAAESAAKAVPSSKAAIEFSYASVVKLVAPAVVNIYTRKVVRTRSISPFFNDPFFRRFFGNNLPFGVPRERIQNSLGSGVIVGADGLIVTNHHVIKGADAITVVLSDRREFEARIISDDERTDLAVLRIDPKGESLPMIPFRDSDELEVGDLVLALGNPFGVGQTVTSGIVSALARTTVGISDFRFFIQTDAAINPGNSGGALVTLDGRLVGINTAIFSRSGGSVGIGFAVPSNMVRAVVAGARGGGQVVRPWFGAKGQGVTADLSDSLGLARPQGVIVNEIYPGGPADRAGLEVGDIVVAVNGREVNDAEALRFRIATLALDGKAKLSVLRRGRERQLTLALLPPPEEPRPDRRRLKGDHPFSGATVANLSPALADELGLDTLGRGVIVLALRRGAPAQRVGLRPGDIVLKVHDEAIKTVGVLVQALERPVRNWRLSIRRGDKVLSVEING